VVGVDLNDGHLAVRRLDAHGNPVGRPERIEVDLAGSSARRDAQVRHAIARLLHYTKRHNISAIAVEDLNFADARAAGRETMGRGQRGKRVRRTVAGRPRCFATALPQRLTSTVSACTRSTPPTPARGETSTGAPLMRTSPDTRLPPP
jgi:hypothetical protein